MNEMNISQVSAVLNEIVEQATGQKAMASITNAADFVSVAQSALKTGYEPILNAMSNVWSKTIFSSRNYNAPGDSLRMDLDQWGAATRKISPVAMNMTNDKAFEWPVAYDASKTPNQLGNGQSVDPWKITKQEVQQTNFYGVGVYAQRYTTFMDQFETAFTGPSEFSAFNAMNLQERSNDFETYRENQSRLLQANYIGSLLAENQPDRVVHCITEYNSETGLTLTAKDVYKPENFAPFIRWVYAKIATVAMYMRERSLMFQTVIDGKPVMRHTPANKLRVAMYTPIMEKIKSMVMSTTFNDEYLKLMTWESVSYWQSIKTPDSISIVPTYTDTSGVLKKGSPTEKAGILAVMHDRDALGYAIVGERTLTTPINPDGAYWNTTMRAKVKTLMDMTEKGVVFLLD